MTASSVLRQSQADLSHRRQLSLRLSVGHRTVLSRHGPWAGLPFWTLCLLEAGALVGIAVSADVARVLLFVAEWGLLYAYVALCRRGRF